VGVTFGSPGTAACTGFTPLRPILIHDIMPSQHDGPRVVGELGRMTPTRACTMCRGLPKTEAPELACSIGTSKSPQPAVDVIHHLGVVDELIERRCEGPTRWPWAKQLRYYAPQTDDDPCRVRMVDAAFAYTFEYQGNAPRLVHTPLTDKCYLPGPRCAPSSRGSLGCPIPNARNGVLCHPLQGGGRAPPPLQDAQCGQYSRLVMASPTRAHSLARSGQKNGIGTERGQPGPTCDPTCPFPCESPPESAHDADTGDAPGLRRQSLRPAEGSAISHLLGCGSGK